MAEIELDVNDVAPGVKIELRMVGLRRFHWRLRLFNLWVQLGYLISPFSLRVVDGDEKACLLYCPYCGHGNAYTLPDGVMWPRCKYCGRQFMVRNWEVVKDPPACDYECGYCEPFGFVPEDGCPIHDGAME